MYPYINLDKSTGIDSLLDKLISGVLEPYDRRVIQNDQRVSELHKQILLSLESQTNIDTLEQVLCLLNQDD